MHSFIGYVTESGSCYEMSLEQPLCLESDQVQAVQLRCMDNKGHGDTVKYCALFFCTGHRLTDCSIPLWACGCLKEGKATKDALHN